MQKIPTLFVRDMTTKLVTPDVTPGCEWVIDGEGVATEKMDGTCCLVRDGKLYKRYDAKAGKTPPPDFVPAQPEPDPITQHWPGWVPVGDGPDDKYHREAWADEMRLSRSTGIFTPSGTHELVGPKIQGNPYGLAQHQLWMHGMKRVPDAPRTFDALRQCLSENVIEGLVWHHPDGRMAKIKRRDFGLQWPAK